MRHHPSGGWQPSATLEVLRLRGRMLADIRTFFSDRGVLEVETPCLSAAATPDPALLSFTTRYTGPLFPQGQTLYLQTSPEFPMKRLLAAGSGSIYQICKVFRDGESGRTHNPEFTLLEWYRTGFDSAQLMDEVEALTHQLLGEHITLAESEKLSYREAFQRHANLDPHTATAEDFAHAALTHEIHAPPEMLTHHDVAIWRDLLLTHLIEPRLGQGRLTFLYDYPASQASLARVRPGNPPLAERFELYLNGVELANGFHELADASEQRTRFERQLHARSAEHRPPVTLDENLLEALANGFPDCSGVALGFDRLVMLASDVHTIGEVIAFPLDRA
jgi:elongation factor P--(R)-beta-lysine ligase